MRRGPLAQLRTSRQKSIGEYCLEWQTRQVRSLMQSPRPVKRNRDLQVCRAVEEDLSSEHRIMADHARRLYPRRSGGARLEMTGRPGALWQAGYEFAATGTHAVVAARRRHEVLSDRPEEFISLVQSIIPPKFCHTSNFRKAGGNHLVGHEEAICSV
ncbi:hypothetical protein OH77DRAFT_1252706 [Trametes cingulata]|nr:hypothetical protein OH77DRAFT_1252706 [Trametes cingulata]